LFLSFVFPCLCFCSSVCTQLSSSCFVPCLRPYGFCLFPASPPRPEEHAVFHADERAQLDVPNLEIGCFSKATNAWPVPIGTENPRKTTVPPTRSETLAGLDRPPSRAPAGGSGTSVTRPRPPAAAGRSFVDAPQHLQPWHDSAGRGRGDAVEGRGRFAPTHPVPR